MAAAIGPRACQVEHRGRLAGIEDRFQLERGDRRLAAGRQAEHGRLNEAALQLARQAPIEHGHLLPTHLQEPGGGHGGAHAGVVDQDHPRAQHPEIFVGRLHELPARSGARTRQVPGRELLRRADVQQVERARLRLGPPGR